MTPASFSRVGWRDFLPSFHWMQGEHVVVVKPTGGGKTTLIGELLRNRAPRNTKDGPAIVIMVTKAVDRTFRQVFPESDGWRRIEEWPPPRHVNKVLLWPRYRQSMTIPEFVAVQRRVFSQAFDAIFGEGGWTVAVDEEHYMCATLGQADRISMFIQQGRSSGLTVVNGIQRPAWVPVTTYPNATHAFIGNTTEAADLKRLADLGGGFSAQLKQEAPTLEFFEFMYVPARAQGKVPVKTTVDIGKPMPILKAV